MAIGRLGQILRTALPFLADERMRFCRLPRGIDPSSITLDREWQPYFGLEIEEAGAFTVALNADHTRLLRAWREEPEPTKELELQPEAPN